MARRQLRSRLRADLRRPWARTVESLAEASPSTVHGLVASVTPGRLEIRSEIGDQPPREGIDHCGLVAEVVTQSEMCRRGRRQR
jgi:hypothetical protein